MPNTWTNMFRKNRLDPYKIHGDDWMSDTQMKEFLHDSMTMMALSQWIMILVPLDLNIEKSEKLGTCVSRYQRKSSFESEEDYEIPKPIILEFWLKTGGVVEWVQSSFHDCSRKIKRVFELKLPKNPRIYQKRSWGAQKRYCWRWNMRLCQRS